MARAPRTAATETQRTALAQRHDGEHRRGAGADADADDVRAGQRVAQDRLEDRAAHAERRADEDPEHRAGQLALHQDVARARDVGAGEDPEEVRQR